MQKKMDHPVLTKWEYVGKAIAWLIPKLDEIKKFAQAVVNTNFLKIRLHWHLPRLETKVLFMHISYS